jgi:hypothetical protein
VVGVALVDGERAVYARTVTEPAGSRRFMSLNVPVAAGTH